MILIGFLFYLAFFRCLYFVFVESKNDILLWRIAWFLLSFLSLLSAMYFSLEDSYLDTLVRKCRPYFIYYFLSIIISFYMGGWMKSKSINEKRKREKIQLLLLQSFGGLLIYLLFKFKLISL